jgi:gamma-glutamyltranspeptidase/glutathione hydrolase
VLQIISRVIDHGMSIHDALCVPKIWNTSTKDNITYENPLKGYEEYAVSEDTVAALTAMGHEKIGTAASGAVQAIEFKADGTLYGTADPRQDGKAVGVDLTK